ncbi:MAG TPA: type II toxin-antitoxin system RelE/ParE family toxin [Candidatus Acidoferrum sp.]|nr:type II toxin-antitoxin system RelE/ParE family toxin [Candidatus Acidoferrum sp.]
MPYKIVLSENATLELEKFDKVVANRIVRKLKSISGNPQRAFVSLAGSKELKLRVGDYRVIAIMLHEEETILITAIGHRKNVYKRR